MGPSRPAEALMCAEIVVHNEGGPIAWLFRVRLDFPKVQKNPNKEFHFLSFVISVIVACLLLAVAASCTSSRNLMFG